MVFCRRDEGQVQWWRRLTSQQVSQVWLSQTRSLLIFLSPLHVPSVIATPTANGLSCYLPVNTTRWRGTRSPELKHRTNYWVAAKPKCCNSHWLNRLSGLLLTTEIHYINCNNSFLRSQGKRSRSQKIVTNISSHLSSLSHFRTFTPVTPLKLVWNLKHTCMGQLYCYNVLLHTKMVHALQCGHGRHFNRPTWNIEIPI